jgi:hypothetical protein
MFLPSSLDSAEIHWTFFFYGSFFLGYFPRVLDNLLYHGLMRENTYTLLVEVDSPLHNFLDFFICGTLLDLFLLQIILYLVFHLCIHLDILTLHCTEVHGYSARGYTVAAHCCISATHCCMVVLPS